MGLFDFLKKKTSTKSGEERKMETHKNLQLMGITINPHLPLLETTEEVTVKSKDDICRRAIASLLAIQVACDISQGDATEETVAFFRETLSNFGVADCLNDTEYRVVFSDTYTERDVISVIWTYEAYWSLVWSLSLIDDIKSASSCCDGETAVRLVSECDTYEQFANKCQLRSSEEILDMLDLYYRYHWACVNKQFDPDTAIGNLNSEVVMERRRGLEWLISEEDDWFEISLDT